jgi:hypothetical protein
MMADKQKWPDEERRKEFLQMIRNAKEGQYVCFEYHDGRTKLTTKSLQKATKNLVDQIDVLIAVDTENSVIIASGELSRIRDEIAQALIDKGMFHFFWELAKVFPNRVAMVKIDRKGNFEFDKSSGFYL